MSWGYCCRCHGATDSWDKVDRNLTGMHCAVIASDRFYAGLAHPKEVMIPCHGIFYIVVKYTYSYKKDNMVATVYDFI